jgi:DNA modification methylase
MAHSSKVMEVNPSNHSADGPNINIQVERWPIERLIPRVNNPRTHSREQVARIAASIQEFGWTNPILVGADDDIIAGHARVLAARKLGMKEVPVILLTHLSPAQRRALVIADNQLALNAGWDTDLLKVELAALSEEGFDVDLLGFDSDELNAYLMDDGAGLTDEDAIGEVELKAVSQPGDLWSLGNHLLLCGDATRCEDVNRVLGGTLADMTFTDPPYGVNYEGKTSRKLRIANDNLGDGFEAFLLAACENIVHATKGAIYLCMSSSELDTLQRVFRQAGGHWSTFVIWAKNSFSLGRSDYQRQYEPILYGWPQGTDHFWCGARNQGDVWFVDKPVRNDVHPTMKPVELVERAVRNSSKGRDIVLDPFGGSGTTLITCEKTRRSARLIELDGRYCDVIIERWQAFTGQKALLSSTGQPFADVKATRAREEA